MERIFKIVPRERIFELTGIQFMPLNTLYQLYATAVLKPAVLERASTLLMMPDLFNYWLTGRKACELTDASTTQFLQARPRTWCSSLLQKLRLPVSILPEIVEPGTVLGRLLGTVSEALAGVPVIAVASHDTASAVGAVPAQRKDAVYLSSGTWSALGAEVAEPSIDAKSLKHNFTNECGLGGSYMFRKNIMGLWLLQECRRKWAEEGRSLGYDELVRMASSAEPFGSFVEPDHESFLAPGDMPGRIAEFCRATGQKPPEGEGPLVRCVLESLALKYRWVLERLEESLGIRAGVIHVVGGGSRNGLLCQLTADATGRPVVAGPDEATASGNVLVQAMAKGLVGSLAEARGIVRASYKLLEYEPREGERWQELYGRFVSMKETSTTLL